jgi:hypothetical protein
MKKLLSVSSSAALGLLLAAVPGCTSDGSNADDGGEPGEPFCGDGKVSGQEECDEDSAICDDSCRFRPTAFRIHQLNLVDPAVYIPGGTACTPVTSLVNGLVKNALERDDNGDGSVDINIVQVLRPHDPRREDVDMSIDFAKCTPRGPGESDKIPTRCTYDAETIRTTLAGRNQTRGTCGQIRADAIRHGTPAAPTGPCFQSEETDLTIDLGRVVVPLADATTSAAYRDGGLVDGVMQGFLSRQTAETLELPASLPLQGKLSDLLSGGTKGCKNRDGTTDMDVDDNGNEGWYFFIEFEAGSVDYTESQ